MSAADEKLEFYGSVSDEGVLTVPQKFNTDVGRLFKGRDVIVTVQRKRKMRSLDQNAYYWAVIVPHICDAMNDAGELVTRQEVHEFLKFRFLRVQKIDEDAGEIIYEYGRSTSSLKTYEFCLYIDNCIMFGSEYLGITIPLPNEVLETYAFPEKQGKAEPRELYLERIGGYLADVPDKKELRRYFNLNKEWEQDAEVRALFNIRREQLN